eukprot:GEMP01054256.1.p1 GENE.GEMP01054256.1~~GEMP01054256.1.p1  ORF type:complete len:238 (+),score=36.15 GEMP01054256.1:102-815(+)
MVFDFLSHYHADPDPSDQHHSCFANSRFHWDVTHNHALHAQQKFMIQMKTPYIRATDLFDLDKFGCHSAEMHVCTKEPGAAIQKDGNMYGHCDHATKDPKMAKFDFGRWWFTHPSIAFGVPLHKIKVTLQNMTTGLLKWSAIYDLHGSNFLGHYEDPLGGEKPFFYPNWCSPKTPGGTSESYEFTVRNLSSKPNPSLDLVGKILFTRYGPDQVNDTYAATMNTGVPEEAGKSELVQE